MLRMRLRREGDRMDPSYRIVVADSSSPRNGGFIEILGIYDPKTNPFTVKIDEVRASHWLKMGASPSEPVARILKQRKISGAGKANEGTH